MGFDDEMRRALEADAAKLSAMTGEDHQIAFLDESGPLMTTDTDTLVALAAQITPGPWREGARFSAIVADHPTGHDDDRSVTAYGGHLVCESVKDFSNASLLVLAPELLSEAIANRARIEALEAEVAHLAGVVKHQDSRWSEISQGLRARLIDMTTQRDEARAGEDEMAATLREGRRAIGEHHAPGDCYATGPLTGDAYRDLVECPACSFIARHDAALASHDKRKEWRA